MHKYKIYDLIIETPFEVVDLIKVKDNECADVVVELTKFKGLPKLEVSDFKRKGYSAKIGYYKNEKYDIYIQWDNIITFKIEGNNKILIETKETDLDLISFFLCTEPIAVLLFNRGYLLIHASSILLPNNTGIIFMGNPGVGKSTTTASFVKNGCKMITDDMVAIKFINEDAFLIPSFPQLKIWQNTVNNLNFDKKDLRPIIEGKGKFSYNNPILFSEEIVPLDSIYYLGCEKDEIQISIKTAMDVLYHCSLPDEKILKGIKLKSFFNLCTKLKRYKVYKKKKLASFEELDIFTKNTILESSN